jgi:formamidopyrimidine-DNA glycosylase
VPELPDVEGFKRVLSEHAAGRQITGIEVRDAGVIRGRTVVDFVGSLSGRVFAEPARAGKWLLAPTDGPTLLAHFGMTGSLLWAGPDEDLNGWQNRYDRVLFDVGTGRLIYRDQRKLRGLWLCAPEEECAALLARQGPDALGLTGRRLSDRLQGHRGVLKAVLMDQSVIAGLGNMLSDEVLWRARIHPARQFASLDTAERRRLDRSLQTVLRASAEQGGIPRTNRWLSSRRNAGGRCPRCHSALRTSRLAGRTSYWCPACQLAKD